MEPALTGGSYFIANKQAYQQQLPQRGDIVLYRDPSSPGLSGYRVSRIVGLPGEIIRVNQGQILINGTLLHEAYVSKPAPYSGEWKIGEGQYFVLGDNRRNSYDSHVWGTLPRKNILAKAVWIYWPSTYFGKVY